MGKIEGMIFLALERLTILKEYELNLITKDEAVENLVKLKNAIEQIGDLKIHG